MVTALWNVLRWCEKRNRMEFERKEIKHLFTNENQSARFGDWLLFGDLVYRPAHATKGHYALNKERIEAFFSGKLKIPTVVFKNPITGNITAEQERFIGEIEKLTNFLTSDQEFIEANTTFATPRPRQ